VTDVPFVDPTRPRDYRLYKIKFQAPPGTGLFTWRAIIVSDTYIGEDASKDILALCDNLRDIDLVPLGVALDDQPDGKALVKLMPPSDLIKARDEKRALADAKAVKKAAAAEAERLKRQQRLEKGRVAPEEMFKPPNVPEGTYSKWDETGMPAMDGEGKELSKSGAKKLAKDWAAQKKLHEEFLVWQKGGR